MLVISLSRLISYIYLKLFKLNYVTGLDLNLTFLVHTLSFSTGHKNTKIVTELIELQSLFIVFINALAFLIVSIIIIFLKYA